MEANRDRFDSLRRRDDGRIIQARDRWSSISSFFYLQQQMALLPMSTTPQSSDPSPELPHPRRGWRTIAVGIVWLSLACALLWWFGHPLWDAYRDYRQVSREAETSAPIGYVGVNLRRTYFDKPLRFFDTSKDRKRLWAAKGSDGKPEFYDVTEAAFEVDRVAGGFGRDSIPGIDYPLFEPPGSDRTSRMPASHPVLGLVFQDGPRSYPLDLLRKIEVVNDQGDGKVFAIVYDRQREQARFFDRRIDDYPITFGTTGYALGPTEDPKIGTPLLYDRKTRSLWLPEESALVCVNGPLQGTKLSVASVPEQTTWSDWSSRYPQTRVLIGSDRDGDNKPIPTE
jgi:hypothetical protein